MPGADRLESDSTAWVAAGLISSEQRVGILAWQRAREPARRTVTTILSITGAIVFVAGITLIVATNWDEISLMTKLATGVALLVAFYAAGYWVRFGPPARTKSGDALMLIGAGVFLGDLALVSQQYHIFESFSVPLLLLWAGIAPLPYLLRSRPFAFVSASAFAAWIGAEMAREGSPITPDSESAVLTMFAGVGVAILAIGALHRSTRIADLAAPIEIVGGVLTLLVVYMLGFYRHFGSVLFLTDPVIALFLGVPALLVVASLAVEAVQPGTGVAVDRRRWPVYSGGALLLAVLGWCVLVALFPEADSALGQRLYDYEERGLIPWTLGFWVLAIALTVALGWLGVAFQRRGWLNSALVFAGLFTLTRYFDLFSSYAQTGLMFIGAGVLLLVVAFALERSRQALTRLSEAPR